MLYLYCAFYRVKTCIPSISVDNRRYTNGGGARWAGVRTGAGTSPDRKVIVTRIYWTALYALERP